jgi:transcriptional regulator with XRE-family HTH domain
MTTTHTSLGDHLREWRQKRRMSQLDLAGEAEISTRHLSFIETGRSSPSREIVLTLAERLDIPLRERNVLLLAAGYAPVYPMRALDDPALTSARQAIDLILRGHEPYPALAIDRHWTLVTANAPALTLMSGVAPSLTAPPVNVLRLSLHPQGLAPRIVNLAEWRAHLLERLKRQIEVSGDGVLIALKRELEAYPAPAGTRPPGDYGGVIVPLKLKAGETVLSFLSTITVFGTPIDVTLAELALESFFPADAATADLLRRLSG